MTDAVVGYTVGGGVYVCMRFSDPSQTVTFPFMFASCVSVESDYPHSATGTATCKKEERRPTSKTVVHPEVL